MSKEFVPETPASKRMKLETVSCRLSHDLIEPFYEACAKAGLSPSRLTNQMIRYALENMKKTP